MVSGYSKFVRRQCTLLVAVATIALFVTASPVFAQKGLDGKLHRSGVAIRSLFQKVVEKSNLSTVSILKGHRQVALGTVVGADGLILTKASELKDATVVRCRLRNGKKFEATIVGIKKEDDLALLKIDVKDLTPIQWRTGQSPQLGHWLATPGMDDVPVSVGVVSVKQRRILPVRGILGIMLEDVKGGTKITEVTPKSGAAKGGLKVGDIVTWAAGVVIKDRMTLSKTLRKYSPGDTVTLKVKRANAVIDIRATLKSASATGSRGFNRGAMQNRMGGALSDRRQGFPVVLQHDMYLRPKDCGGPAVDLKGKAVGINIARAGRTESYTIPADRILKVLPELKSGKLAPKKESVPVKEPAVEKSAVGKSANKMDE